MATSSTYTFNLTVDELLEEAYERAGIELRSGYQLKSARRSLNLILLEWANKGVNLFTVDNTAIPLSIGVSTYSLPADYVDIVDAVVRDTNGTDLTFDRISLSEYLNRPNKTTPGRPVQYTIERDAPTGGSIYVWPVPDRAGYSIQAMAYKYIQDVGAYTNEIAVPLRFLPCLIARLAFALADKALAANGEAQSGATLQALLQRRQELKMEAEEQWLWATSEDRERASMYITPLIGRR